MAESETIMGDSLNHHLFANPNISIHKDNANSDEKQLLKGVTLMGLSTESQPLNFKHSIMDNIPSNNLHGITLMGHCNHIKFPSHNTDDYKLEKYTDLSDASMDNEIQFNQSITLMGDTNHQSQPKRKKKISSESYWKMFVFQQPHIFTQIISYLLPFQKLHLSNISSFIHQFIAESQLKYILESNDEKMSELQPIKLKTLWKKYDVIDYDMDYMIWNNQYYTCMDSTNYKSLVINVEQMSLFYTHSMDKFWSSDLIKQLKYFLINQTKLSSIYHLMELNRIEDTMYYSNSFQDLSPLSQRLMRVTHLCCNGNGIQFGMNGIRFCQQLFTSKYCGINALYLRNDGLTDECVSVFCDGLLQSQNVMISGILELDLSYNRNISGECMEVLFTLIGEKCRLKKIDLSYTSVDNRVCECVYEYYRCYYGSEWEWCNLKCIDLNGNACITMGGVRRMNEIFVNECVSDVIIASENEDVKISLVDCEQLRDLTRPPDLDHRIII